MGWSSGSALMSDIVTSLNEKFPDDPELRKQIYLVLIPEFENYDADNLCEVEDDTFEEALKEINPPAEWYDGPWGIEEDE